MKRKLLYAISFLFISWAANSCEALTDCKVCRLVMTDTVTGVVTEDRNETEYCGADLIAVQVQKPIISGTTSTEYECR